MYVSFRSFDRIAQPAPLRRTAACGVFAAAALLGALPPAAMAQDSTTGFGQLEEIVVTAQKRVENAQKVPITVTALSADQLQASGVVSTASLPNVVSGLAVGAAVSAFQPRLRGVGTAFFGPGIENPVALYIDNVYYSSQLTAPTDLSDLSQLAVLKGPQGTLFGRNSTGGVLQMTTREPEAAFGGEFRTELDNYLTSRNFAYVTGGVSDTLTTNLSVKFAGQGDGWGNNLTNGDEIHRINSDFSVRNKWHWTPSDALTVKLSLDFASRNDTLGPSYRPYADSGVPAFFPGMGTTVFSDNIYDSTSSVTAKNRLRHGGASVAVEYDAGFARVVSISAYRKSHFFSSNDSTGATPLVSGVIYDTHGDQFSQEFQLLSNSDGAFTWVAGAYYFRNTDDLDPQHLLFYDASASVGGDPRGNLTFPFLPPGSTVNSLDYQTDLKTESLAAFGQGTFAFTDNTRLTAGVRYTTEDRFIDSTINLRVDDAPPFVFQEQHAKFTDDRPTWRLALDHDLGDDAMVYASYNRGFKSGGFNAFFPAPPYKPEVVDAYELGLKSELLDRTLRLNTAAFYSDYSNIQLLVVNGFSLEAQNAAGAEIYGLDIDAEWRASSELTFTAGAEWLHSRFTDFANLPYALPVPGGGIVSSSSGLPQISGDGKSLAFAPDFTLNIAANYTLLVGAEDKIDFNLTEAYNDGFYFEPDNFTKQGSFSIMNASATWTGKGDRTSVGVFVRNILDEEVPVFVAATAPHGYLADYSNPPRTYGVTAQYRFGN